MTRVDPEGGMKIGSALKRARTRQGLDLSALEERTKIRTRYLRALESEDWETLPSPAYTKGFLRTYAQSLGLDAEALVDEYRRQVESSMPQEHPYPVSEPLLEGSRRPGDPRGWRSGARAVVLAAVGVLAVLLVLGLFAGDEGDSGQERRASRQAQERRQEIRRQERRRERRAERRREEGERKPEAKRLTLRLELNSDLQVCLVGDDDSQPLIDDQVLTGGSTEGPYEAKRFDLRFPYGYDRQQFALFVNGDRVPLPETLGPTAYAIVPPAKVRPQESTTGCP